MTVTNLADQHATQVLTATAPSYVAVVNRLAKQLSPDAGQFSTSNDDALRAYAAALETTDRAGKESLLRQAIAFDPHFGMAYLSLIEQQSSDPTEASQTLAAAHAQSAGFVPLDRARLAVMAARIGREPLAQQTAAMQAMVNLAPNDVDSLASLGTERFLLGEAQAGEADFRKAIEIAPNRTDIKHALALGLLTSRRFEKAAQVFQTLGDNPNEQQGLAICLLLSGHVAEADKVMSAYFAARRASAGPGLALIHANWTAVSRGIAEAAGELQGQTFTVPLLNSIAQSQLAIWDLALGRQTVANQLLARNSAFKTPVAEAYRNAATGRGDPKSLAFSLFLHGEYADAAQAWAEIVKQTAGLDLRARAMLASSLEHAGRNEAAKDILVQPFAPDITGADPFSAISFNEMRRILKL